MKNKYFGCLEVPNSTVVMPFYDAERDEMNDAVEVVSMAFVSNCKPPSGFAAEQLSNGDWLSIHQVPKASVEKTREWYMKRALKCLPS